MIILHLAAYNRNIGDSIAIENIRHEFPDYIFKSLDIQHPAVTNKILEQNYDMLLIGGGGLIEGGNWNNTKYGWKLPFTEKELKSINKPIVVFAVGLNFFRGLEKLNSKGEKNLRSLIDKSRLFSVRNDYSGREIKNYYSGDKVQIIPDPGVIQQEVMQRKTLNKILLSPAFNKNPRIMEQRNVTPRQIQKIQDKYNCDCIAHTGKDFLKGLKQVVKNDELSAAKFSGKFFNKYDGYDLVLAMRGHAQLVAYGKGIPCIAISSQNKLTGFYRNVEMDEYLVDTNNKEWMDKLSVMINSIKENPEKWYDIRNKHIGKLRQDFYNFCEQMRNINGTT